MSGRTLASVSRPGEVDLHPDVRPALCALRERGLWVEVAGNQTVRAAELLRALELPVGAVATSGGWEP
jgi:predicted phosphatase